MCALTRTTLLSSPPGGQAVQSIHSALWAYCRHGCGVQIDDPSGQRRFPSSVVVGTFTAKESRGVGSLQLAYRNVILSYCVWLTLTRTLKLLPHLWNRPEDIIYVPAFIAFGYYFAIMKLYALLTLHEVSYRVVLARTFFNVNLSSLRLDGVRVPVSAVPLKR